MMEDTGVFVFSVNFNPKLHFESSCLIPFFLSYLKRDLMLQPVFKNRIKLLNKYGYTYDILFFPHQLKYAKELVAAFPGQPFVIDYIAKPAIKNMDIAEWKK
jgi:predicted TIM-barrel fold metal-dependent hydrolase